MSSSFLPPSEGRGGGGDDGEDGTIGVGDCDDDRALFRDDDSDDCDTNGLVVTYG